jgi:hypothetical protein
VNVYDLYDGIVEFHGIKTVKIPHAVSIPNQRGQTTKGRISLISSGLLNLIIAT